MSEIKYNTGDIHNQEVTLHLHEGNRKDIMKVFWILLGITLFEVGIAFSSTPKWILQIIFIVMTIVKAAYIVFTFMHLKHEKTFFKYVILLPFLFIVYLIAISLKEGTAMQELTDFLSITFGSKPSH